MNKIESIIQNPNRMGVVSGVLAMIFSVYLLDRLGDRFGDLTPVIGVSPLLLAGLAVGFFQNDRLQRLLFSVLMIPCIVFGLGLPAAIFFSQGSLALVAFVVFVAACAAYTLVGIWIGKKISIIRNPS